MMIRINLLPVRAVKKRELGRQVLVLFAAVLLLTGVLNYLWYSDRDTTSTRNREKIAQTTQRIAELEKVIGQVNDINKRKKEVEEKLGVLDNLRKGRSGPVKMMDALSVATPKKVWLSDFAESGGTVHLAGTAFSHEDVAEFMRSLANVVWTPKGMGRLVEQKRDSKMSRVELLSQDGAVDEFNVNEIGTFFTGIDLKRAEQGDAKGLDGTTINRAVTFAIDMTANYAI